MSAKKSDITVHDLVAHMRGMEQRLAEQIENLRTDLHFAETRLTAEIRGTDELDERVQEIEEEHLPDRMQSVEKAVGLLG